MTTRSLTFNQQTRLSVSVIIEDDTGLLAFSILVATRLFVLFWQLSGLLSSTRYELAMLVSDLRTALDFTGKVLAIIFVSLAYGFGVKL